jgi:hypothetical protein
VRGTGLLLILFIRNEHERLKLVDLSETFVFLLQHSLQLIYSWTKLLSQRWKQKKHPQYNHDVTVPQNLVKTKSYSG